MLIRFFLHFLSSAALVIMAFFFARWLQRRWPRVLALLLATVLVFAVAVLREPWDVAAGQSLGKVVSDFLSWALGCAATAYALYRLGFRS